MVRKSLDHIERGTCDGCSKQYPGWALYGPLDSDAWSNAVCGGCITAHEAVEEEPLVLAPWETEAGKYLKAQRNMLLSFDTTGWAMMSDSPVTEACREAFKAYRAILNRMTVDYDDPADWEWPEVPALEYPVNGEAHRA